MLNIVRKQLLQERMTNLSGTHELTIHPEFYEAVTAGKTYKA